MTDRIQNLTRLELLQFDLKEAIAARIAVEAKFAKPSATGQLPAFDLLEDAHAWQEAHPNTSFVAPLFNFPTPDFIRDPDWIAADAWVKKASADLAEEIRMVARDRLPAVWQ